MNATQAHYRHEAKLRVARKLKERFDDPRSVEELEQFIGIDRLDCDAISCQKLSATAIVEEQCR
jgi:hypothetical protein